MAKVKLRLISIEEITDKRLKVPSLKVILSRDLDIHMDLNKTPEDRRMTFLYLNEDVTRDFFINDPYGIKEIELDQFEPVFFSQANGDSKLVLQHLGYLASVEEVNKKPSIVERLLGKDSEKLSEFRKFQEDFNVYSNGAIEIILNKNNDEISAEKPDTKRYFENKNFAPGVKNIFITLLQGLIGDIEGREPLYHGVNFKPEKNGRFQIKINFTVLGKDKIKVSQPDIIMAEGFSKTEFLDSILWYQNTFYKLSLPQEQIDYLVNSIE